MMTRNVRFFTVLFLLLTISVQGQQLSKSNLLEDLRFLDKAVQNGHPVNYRRAEKITFDSLILAVERHFPDSLSWRQYEAAIRFAVWEIGCVHTSVKKSPLKSKETQPKGFFPLDVFTDGKRLFVSSTDSVLWAGDEILSINGVSSQRIVDSMLRYKSPDGRSITFARQIINRNFPALYYIYFGVSASYEIAFSRGGQTHTLQLNGKGKSALSTKEWKPGSPAGLEKIYEGKEAYFGMLPGNVAYLKLDAFKKKYKPFYRKMFRHLEKNPPAQLIIDLRDNLGGSRAHAEALLSHLIARKTSYDVIRPKNNLGDYLKGKEKMKFWMSFIFYDVKALFKRKKLADGVSFTYKVKPKKKVLDQQPIYLLVNGYTASSSTIVATYLKHYNHAIVIGEQTSGGEFRNNGGSYPNLILPRSGIEIRTSTYRLEYDFAQPGDSGIVPDYEIVYDHQNFLKSDLELQKALELIDAGKNH